MYITSEKTLIFRITNIFDIGSDRKCFEDYADPNLWQLKVKRVELEDKDYLEMTVFSKNIDSDEEWVRSTDRKVQITSKKNNLILQNTNNVYLLEWKKLIDPNNEYITDSNYITVEITVEKNIGFHWRFPNISKLDIRSTFSNEFSIANIPWKLDANTETSDRTGNEKYLAVFLTCNKNKNSSSWAVRANFQICLLSQKQGIKGKLFELKKTLFTSQDVGWGTHKLIKWDDLIEPEKGYILDDTIEIKVLITGATKLDHTSQADTDEQLKELLSKYFERSLKKLREQLSSEIEEEQQRISSQNKDKTGETTCGICKEKYSDIIELKRIPRILSGCPTSYKHSMCESCAENIMVNRTIKCPFDRSITEVPDGDVRRLTKNGYLLDLLAEETFKSNKNSKHDVVYCDDDKTHIATQYCLECQANFCSSCLNAFHNRPSLSKHTIVSIHERIQNVRCPEHVRNFVELYCIEESCKGKRMMCLTCSLYGIHKGHKNEMFNEKLKCVQESWKNNMNFVETTMKTLEKENKIIKKFHGIIERSSEAVEKYATPILDALMTKMIKSVNRQKKEYLQKRSEDFKGFYKKIEKMNTKMKNIHTELLAHKNSDISTFFESSSKYPNQESLYKKKLEDIIESFSPSYIPLFHPDNILKIANDFGVYTRIVICGLFENDYSESFRKMIGDVFQKNTEAIPNFENLRKYEGTIVELNPDFNGLGIDDYDSVIILVSRAEFKKHRKLIYAFTKNLSNYIVAVERAGIPEEIDFRTMNGVLYKLTEGDTWSIIQKLLS